MAESLERCPKCGMPYMSGMLSNETAQTRYCYTCDVEKGRNVTAERAEHAADAELDDLSLQNATAIDGKFAKRKVTNLRAQVVATARAKPKPQPAQPVQPQSVKALEELQLNTVTSATSNPPPPPRKLNLKKRGSGPALPVIGILAGILLAFFVVKNFVFKSEPEASAPEPVKTAPQKPKPVAAPTSPKPKPPPPPPKEEKPAPSPDEYDIVTGQKLKPSAKPKQP